MSSVKKVSRQERAAGTRRRMLAAAYDLFCQQGYRPTTMDAIAERAGVAVQTLYFTFHTKDALLQAVHQWTVLGDEPVRPDEQPWHRAARAEPDPHLAVRTVVDGISRILLRVAPMVPVFHSVSADAAGEVYRHAEELRRRGMVDLAADLARKAPLATGLDVATAADLLFVLTGPEVYRSFVIDAGWAPERWAAWTTRVLVRELFAL